jgi:hypothetical protein
MIKKIKQIYIKILDIFDLCGHKFAITNTEFKEVNKELIVKTTMNCVFCDKEIREYKRQYK